MKRQFFKKLSDYGAREAMEGKRVFVQYHEDDESPMGIYGTIVEWTGKTITLGDFVDIHFVLNYANKLKNAGTQKEVQTAIRQLEFLHSARLKTTPRVFNLNDKVECYVIDTSESDSQSRQVS